MTGTGPLTLIGGEMLGWSDVRRCDRAPAGGPALTQLAGLVAAGGRVLVAGPHDVGLVVGLRDTGVAVTCLVRSLPDAQAAVGLGVEVLCGTLPKLAAEPGFDAVFALDGLDRLCSTEGPQLTWAESLRAVRAALRPGGTLLLGVANELGVHRLVDPSPATTARTDADWHLLGEFDTSRPARPAGLAGRLAQEGLHLSQLYAGWPLPHAPTVLAAVSELASPGGLLVAAVAGAYAGAYAGRSVLSDPRRLAAAAVRAGVGAELAACWIVLAHRGDEDTPDRPDPSAVPPPVLLADAGGVHRLSRDAEGRLIRRADPVADPVADPAPAGRVRRDPGLLDGPAPTGRLFEESLLGACLRHDLPTVRRLLTGYLAWLAGDVPSAGQAFATFDNVLLDGTRFAVLDPSWTLSPPVAVPVAAGRALRRFATMLIRGGYPHPWSPTAEVDVLTATLAGAAGLSLSEQLCQDVIAVDVDILAAVAALPVERRPALVDEVREAPAAAALTEPDSWRERQELLDRLRGELAQAQAKCAWYDAELAKREAELHRARLLVSAFSGSSTFRLLRLGYLGTRYAVQRVRRLLRRT